MNEEFKGSNCPGCGQPVSCGAARSESTCWCAELPAMLPMPGEKGGACYCRRCLEAKLNLAQQTSRT